MKRLTLVLLGILAAAIIAVGVDRISLAIWRSRIESYSAELQRAAEGLNGKRGTTPASISWNPETGGRWPVPFIQVAFRGPKPSFVTVGGNGSLGLFYAPPALAWSRHLPFLGRQRPAIQAADIYSYNDVYILRVETMDPRSGGDVLAKPRVSLEHGLPF